MKKLCLIVTAVFALAAVNSGPVRAQTADVSAKSDQELAALRKQIRELEQKDAELRRQVGEIKKKLAVASTKSNVAIAPDAAHAMAADMPVKAAPYVPPVQPFSWTGFYVGGTIGYGWRTVDNTLAVVQTSGFPTPPISFAANDPINAHGVIGGIEAGYNWQVRNFVFGIEADFSWSDIKGSHEFSDSFPVSFGGIRQQPVTVTDNSNLRWLGTLRGRIGYANDQWLIFASGGVAYGEVEVNGVAQLPLQTGVGFNAPWTWSNSITKVGWVVGAGAEYAITRNFTLKAEYLYVDLGDVTANVSGGIGFVGGGARNCYGDTVFCGFFANPPSGTAASHLAMNIVRFGMNYKF